VVVVVVVEEEEEEKEEKEGEKEEEEDEEKEKEALFYRRAAALTHGVRRRRESQTQWLSSHRCHLELWKARRSLKPNCTCKLRHLTEHVRAVQAVCSSATAM
jgi:hypothetical protein